MKRFPHVADFESLAGLMVVGQLLRTEIASAPPIEQSKNGSKNRQAAFFMARK